MPLDQASATPSPAPAARGEIGQVLGHAVEYQAGGEIVRTRIVVHGAPDIPVVPDPSEGHVFYKKI